MAEFMGNMILTSIISGVIIILVLCITPFLKRYTRRWRYIVFLVIGIRLILPASLFSMEPKITIPIHQNEYVSDNGNVNNSISMKDTLHEKEQGKDIASYKNNTESNQLGTVQSNTKNSNSSQGTKDTYEAVRNTDTVTEKGESSKIQFAADTEISGNVAEEGFFAQIVNTVSQWNTNTILQIVFIVWAVIAALLILFYILIYRYHRWNIRRWSCPVTDENILNIFEEEKQRIGITKKVGLGKCRKISTPMAVGIIHISILIPEMETDYNELRYILRHELVHQKRHDMCVKVFFVFVKSIHWFNPLVQIMTKKAYDDMELLCDDEVVRHMERDQRISYNETILNVARKQAESDEAEKVVFSLGLVQGKKDLKERMLNIMNMKNRRKGYVIAALMCVVVVAGGSLIACGNAGEKKPETKIEETTTQEVTTEEATTEEITTKEETTKPEETTPALSKKGRKRLEALASSNELPEELVAAIDADDYTNTFSSDRGTFSWNAVVYGVANLINFGSEYVNQGDINSVSTEYNEYYWEVKPEFIGELNKLYAGKVLSPDTMPTNTENVSWCYDAEKNLYHMPMGDRSDSKYYIDDSDMRDDGTMVLKGHESSYDGVEGVGYTITVRYTPDNIFGYTIEDMVLTDHMEPQEWTFQDQVKVLITDEYNDLISSIMTEEDKIGAYAKDKDRFFWETIKRSMNKGYGTEQAASVTRHGVAYFKVREKEMNELANMLIGKNASPETLNKDIPITYDETEKVYYVRDYDMLYSSSSARFVYNKKKHEYSYDAEKGIIKVTGDMYKVDGEEVVGTYQLTFKENLDNSYGFTITNIKKVKKK